MPRGIKVTIIGGGSVDWSPKLLSDLMHKQELRGAEFRLLDIDLTSAKRIACLGQMISEKRKWHCTFIPTKDEDKALDNTDFVIITISTGGLDAMGHDLKIPEKYGIFQTVGDTVGPGGWARGLRNIPVFIHLAEKIKRNAPNAVILNYTNPMSTLTKTLTIFTEQKVVGLCHGVFESYRTLMDIFGLKKESELNVSFGGINHFFWLMDIKIRGKDGYRMLRNKLKGRNFAQLLNEIHKDEAGFSSKSWITGELLNEFGCLPYSGDRHISEFFSRYLASDKTNIKKYHLRCTTVNERKKRLAIRTEWLKAVLAGKDTSQWKWEWDPAPSRETAADIISTLAFGGEFIDVMNVPNRGQISNLPYGSVVETLGVINPCGFAPITVGELPEEILPLVLRHVLNQDLIVEAGIEGDSEKAFAALANDPLCSHLTYPDIRRMGDELLKANRKYLPQFYK
ncbi:hypothetical protein KKC91_06810 [bacterium]|nr:hypothetical protein [bacterium]